MPVLKKSTLELILTTLGFFMIYLGLRNAMETYIGVGNLGMSYKMLLVFIICAVLLFFIYKYHHKTPVIKLLVITLLLAGVGMINLLLTL
jgi:multidrug transporter EmrE-like cation transporter